MPADSTSPSVPDLHRRVDELAAELRARTSDHEEALRREAAIAEILQVTNETGGDLAKVFGTMIAKAAELCAAPLGHIWTYDGERTHPAAVHGDPGFTKWLMHQGPIRPGSAETPLGRVLVTGRLVHTIDAREEEGYRGNHPVYRELVDRAAIRSILVVPMRKGDTLLGAISVYRRERRPFTPDQIRLLEAFADQAVIAMENARLIAEQRETLEQQTATAEVLRVISQSPTDVAPVLQAVGAAARRFCGAEDASIFLRDGEEIVAAAHSGSIPALAIGDRDPLGPSTIRGQAIIESRTVQISDTEALDPDQYTLTRAYARQYNFRAAIAAPMLRDGRAIGCIAMRKPEPGPFTARQIALLESFAAQAVIAIENTRLFTELRQRTDDLTESLEYQTATSELLEVISRSTTDVQPVLDTMLASAARLCGTNSGGVAIRRGAGVSYVASFGQTAEFDQMWRTHEFMPDEATVTGRVLLTRQVVHVADMAEDLDHSLMESVTLGGMRTALGVPLLREGEPIGVIMLNRDRVEPFTDRQIALVRTFADQAVIAMENARLLGELREALEQQTATAEVLQVINTSPGNIVPVFETILEKAHALCGVAYGSLQLYDGTTFRAVAVHSLPEPLANRLRHGYKPGPNHPVRRLLDGEDFVHVHDFAEIDDPIARTVEAGGIRTALFVALRNDRRLVGMIVAARREVRPFAGKETALLHGFAAQAVIAIENARLFEEVQGRTRELTEALEKQQATSEVLGVISSSPEELEPVFRSILSNAIRLCQADLGNLFLYEDNAFRVVAMHGASAAHAEAWQRDPCMSIVGRPHIPLARVAATRQVVHIRDIAEQRAHLEQDPRYTLLFEGARARTMLLVPMLKEEDLIGAIVIYAPQVGRFDDKHIDLVVNFARQAVIAIENSRLLDEIRQRQAELRVTIDNMGDGVAMFDDDHRLAAWNRNFQEIMSLSDEWLGARPTYAAYLGLLADRGEFGAENVEAELASRLEHTERELRLERTRADGSVIEVRRNAVPGGGFVLIYSDVTERRRAEAAVRAARDTAEAALERQTATADILKVIASSPTDVQPVLEAVAKAAVQFCGATDANIHLRDGEEALSAAHHGPLRAGAGHRRPLDRETGFGTAILDRRIVHYPDVEDLDAMQFATTRRLAAQFGFRAVLAAPLSREGTAIGALSLRRAEPGPFTPQQVELLETFAAQAVIAIENVRMFTELRESLEQQTATAEILRAISQSPTDVQPVLDAVVKAAVRFCGASDASITLREETEIAIAAHAGNVQGEPAGTRTALDRGTVRGRSILDAATVHVPDILALEHSDFGPAQQLARMLGFRSIVSAPMMRDDGAIGCITLRKAEPEAFTPRQVELLETFAAQAVIAIENVRLFTELRDSLERLKAAQANLIQSEKMASLGQLTAGIAHEIKNPLNFVNNFSGLSGELLDELKEAAAPVLAGMNEGARAEFAETVELLTSNLHKIAEHGKRADGIVKSMLSHSRGGTGDWQESNINALVEEALNLAYHGARAQDGDFNVTLERDFAPEAKLIEVVPQDVTRVFLNLFGNGFYATRKRHLGGTDAGYRPTLRVSTRDLGEAVEVRVRDNGTGIRPEVRAKLFQPFFTTKPTGEGTGLGLSISYDIVTQQHGGSIDVESEPGSFTEFTVRLPRRRRAA